MDGLSYQNLMGEDVCKLQLNLDLTKCQGTIRKLVHYIEFLFHTFQNPGLENVLRYTENFVI